MSNPRNRFFLGVVCALSLVVFAMLMGAPLSAQSTFGSITGTVADATGAAVPGAAVTLTNEATGATQTVTTGADGLYSFVNLNPGEYRVDAEKTSFKHFKREHINIEVQQSARIDVSMQLGAVNQTVEVTGETPLLQTTTTSLGQVIDETQVDQLPLNGRNVFNLVSLAPSVIAQGGSGGSPVGQNPFSWGNYQVGGSFGNESAEYLDGQPLNIGYINLPILIPDQDSISEFKVQYNNLGPEWGKFAGGIVNLSTKGGSNDYHGEAYEYLRNKVLNSRGYFAPVNPPYVQNQFGGTFGGPVIKNKTFFFFGYDGYRQRTASTTSTTVPTADERNGIFPFPIFDPLSVTTGCVTAAPATSALCGRTEFAGDTIPMGSINPAAAVELKFIPMPTSSGLTNNYVVNSSSGGDTNQYVARVDQKLTDKQHIFARYNWFHLLDLPTDPFGTGLCADRCAEVYQSSSAAVDYNYILTPNLIADVNFSASRFHYLRSPKNSNFDLTQYGWPSSYNDEVPGAARSPFTPCFSPEDSTVTCSQGQSFITDHDTQFNFSPSITWIKGRHTFVFGGQIEETYDNYAQTNIASGAFAFNGSWTNSNAVSGGTGGSSFADFLLGYGLNETTVFNHSFGEATVPALTAGKETYRSAYFGDTWRVTSKLTLNFGVRYDLPGTWSERFNDMSYWDPAATNRTVTGCSGTPGVGVCPGDVFLVGDGANPTRNNLPLTKTEFMPRLGAAYSWDQKTVIRAGFGLFFIPNWVFFNLNPSNDTINDANTLWLATTNGGLTPNSTLTATNCTFAPESLTCPTNGPFGPNIVTPLGRGNASAFAAGTNITEAPYTNQKYAYVEQYNLDIQRELPMGIFIDVAYAGSKGVHLANPTASQVNQISDSILATPAAQAGSLAVKVPNPFVGINTVSSLNPSTSPTVLAGQLLRPYPEYGGVALAGFGCCGSTYNSLQVTAKKRFRSGGTFLAAYTNAKLLTNADTLTTWLESGVGEVQDWNNLKGEKSLSSQDVSQRLVVSYVYDLPFGRGQRYMTDASGIMGKVVSGWGINGITTFQKGFPLPISYGASTPLSQAGLGTGVIRPDVVPGCDKSTSHVTTPGGIAWINTNCFTEPGDWAFGNEARVDPTLRSQGINNWDFAIFKTTNFGPDNKLGLEFRTEFFNTFNRVQFAPPNTACCETNNASFGLVTAQLNNPRLIQFGLKFLF
jgi:hypothetical protein